MTPYYPPTSVYEIQPLSPDRAARRAQLITSLMISIPQPENVDGVGAHYLGTYYAFKPTNFWENWLAGQAALLMFRIQRNQRIERRVRDLASLRAIDCWEVDQAQLAERTAAKLATKPSEAYAALWTTLAGCDWMLARWAELETDDLGGWTTEQRTLAHQLYPFEPERLHRPGTIEYHVDQLRAQRSRMVEADQVERALVEADLADHLGPAIKEVRRVGRALEKRLSWCLQEIRTPIPKRLDREIYYPHFMKGTSIHPEGDKPIPAPAEVAATNPTADQPEISQTNPIEPELKISQTNPTEAQTLAEIDLATNSSEPLTVPIDGHRRRVDPSAELARQRRAARHRRA